MPSWIIYVSNGREWKQTNRPLTDYELQYYWKAYSRRFKYIIGKKVDVTVINLRYPPKLELAKECPVKEASDASQREGVEEEDS